MICVAAALDGYVSGPSGDMCSAYRSFDMQHSLWCKETMYFPNCACSTLHNGQCLADRSCLNSGRASTHCCFRACVLQNEKQHPAHRCAHDCSSGILQRRLHLASSSYSGHIALVSCTSTSSQHCDHNMSCSRFPRPVPSSGRRGRVRCPRPSRADAHQKVRGQVTLHRQYEQVWH